MKKWYSRAIVGMLLAACHTEIAPLVRTEQPTKKTRRGPSGECWVDDYRNATDVPAGSKNLGWVRVPYRDNDDASLERLRKEVCAKGGDAMSQMHWIRSSGSSIAEPPVELEGNAWLTP